MPNEHTIAENLQRLVDAKTAIGNAITAKGGTVGASDGLEEFATAIAGIQTGVDTSNDTVNLMALAVTFTAHDKSGNLIQGELNSGVYIFPDGTETASNIPISSNNRDVWKYIVIPRGVTTVGRLGACANVEKIYVSEDVNSFSIVAIDGMPNLKAIVVDDKNNNYMSDNGILFNKSKTQIFKYPPIDSEINYAIPIGVEEIKSYCFEDCSNLITLEIPSSVITIDTYPFQRCTSLTTITIDKPADSISGSPWGAYNATIVWTG